MKVLRSDLSNVAQEVLRIIKSSQVAESTYVIALQGDLGAGKTTFVQAIGKELGVQEIMQSPTYVLMKSYLISFGRFTKLVHIDAYRLGDPEEFLTLKPQEFLRDAEALIFIEWPEKVGDLLPTPNLAIQFVSEGIENERIIEIQSHEKD